MIPDPSAKTIKIPVKIVNQAYTKIAENINDLA